MEKINIGHWLKLYGEDSKVQLKSNLRWFIFICHYLSWKRCCKI